MTFFVYLTTLPKGVGSTVFPRLSEVGKPRGTGRAIRPMRGRAVLWSNVDTQTGLPDISVGSARWA